ncbi:glycosyl hydrolase family 28-related protein [Rariglobus hedericola]|nr:glycosyl hydrolase family 28-related protein [Rariglobus hedericola]
MMRPTFCAPLLLSLTLLSGCQAAPKVPETPEPAYKFSKLWGSHGDVWIQGGRLPDFSYAGYRNGETPIPDYPVVATVTDFGAKGDDDVDDTAAFQAALAKSGPGAVLVPPGRYIISGLLRINKPGVVLRGSGTERTTLFFPKPLDDLEPNTGATTGGRPTSNYSWSGGFVRLQGDFKSAPLTPITSPAVRGERIIVVEKPAALKVGQSIEVRVTDTPENTLASYLYSDDAGDMSQLKGTTFTSIITKITRIDGDRVELQRALRFDLRPEWKPEVRAFEPTVRDSGVEDLAFEFPNVPYEGHFTEKGFNPVAFGNVADCWARRLKFINPDSGPMVGGVFNTVSDVVFESQRAPDSGGNQGHHGIYLQNIGDHLFTRFDFRMKFVHDITSSKCAGAVISEGKGVDLCFDFHKRAPYDILITQVDLGRGTRPWKSGGGAALGKHGGARITFWNLQAAGTLPEPTKEYGPWSMNFVAVDLGRPSRLDALGLWREAIPKDVLYPQNLHDAQLARRVEDAKR